MGTVNLLTDLSCCNLNLVQSDFVVVDGASISAGRSDFLSTASS